MNMRDEETIEEFYYEIEVNGGFYDYSSSIDKAEEIAEMLIKESDISSIDIWEVSRKLKLVKEYDSCG
ncbi:hypothetical protein N9Y08_04615 [Paracoccaceae bacterium]|nr:hypothetical protein [Paracoccaceae bacterium]